MAENSPLGLSPAPIQPLPTLTPARKRRTRPSLSPLKAPKLVSMPERPQSTSFEESTALLVPREPEEQPSGSKLLPHEPLLPTAALEFEEFSFVGADGSIGLRNISDDHIRALHIYLSDHFNVAIVDYSEPFMILGCDDPVPTVDERPFSIAGLIAIWKPVNDMHFHPFLGEWGGGGKFRIDDPAIVEALEERKIPSDDAILFLADHVFPDCEALSLMWRALVVELPKTSDEEFAVRLESLPGCIEGVGLLLQYHNGPLANTERRRQVVSPKPVFFDRLIADETDYLQIDGKFYPGTVVSSLDKEGQIYSSVSAGVLVEKDGEKRLTCSWHNWEDHVEKCPGKLGETDDEARRVLRAAQGVVDGQPGTTVGDIRGRVGDTDVALMQLDDGVVFENKFLEMNAVAKTFLPFRNMRPGDSYLIDSYVTGLQMLKGYGFRYPIERRRRAVAHSKLSGPEGHHHCLPPDTVAYIKAYQGVFATNAPMIASQSQIRDSVCGTVLLRCGKAARLRDVEEDVLDRGEVCGMMHYADLQEKYASSAANFLIYADTFEPLTQDGWTIVQPVGDGDTKEEEAGTKGEGAEGEDDF